MVYLGWDVYRWAVRQMQIQPDAVKDELRVFLGSHPHFKEIEDYLPTQRGKELDGSHLDLKKHQSEALKSLQAMRDNGETIALLYHATGTGKTVTAVMDAKNCGGRTLFLAHTQELVNQAAETFRKLWPSVTVGRYVESMKQPNAHVVCGSVQSVALHLDEFQDDAFDYAELNMEEVKTGNKTKRSLYSCTATFSGAPDWIRTSGLPGRSSQTHNTKRRCKAISRRLCTNKKTI